MIFSLAREKKVELGLADDDDDDRRRGVGRPGNREGKTMQTGILEVRIIRKKRVKTGFWKSYSTFQIPFAKRGFVRMKLIVNS